MTSKDKPENINFQQLARLMRQTSPHSLLLKKTSTAPFEEAIEGLRLTISHS